MKLSSIYDRHQNDLKELKNKNNKYSEELVTYEDTEAAKQNMKQQEIDLEMRVKSLGSTLKSTLLAVDEAYKRKSELEVKINNFLVSDCEKLNF